MEAQVAEAVKVLAQAKNSRESANMMERDVVVLWGMYRGWANTFSARMIHSTRGWVRKRKEFFSQDPRTIFEMPVLHQSQRIFRCEFCGDHLPYKAEKQARMHVASHVVSQEAVHVNGVM